MSKKDILIEKLEAKKIELKKLNSLRLALEIELDQEIRELKPLSEIISEEQERLQGVYSLNGNESESFTNKIWNDFVSFKKYEREKFVALIANISYKYKVKLSLLSTDINKLRDEITTINNHLIVRICPNCKKEETVIKGIYMRKYCSDECKKEARSKREKENKKNIPFIGNIKTKATANERRLNKIENRSMREDSKKILDCSVDCLIEELGDIE